MSPLRRLRQRKMKTNADCFPASFVERGGEALGGGSEHEDASCGNPLRFDQIEDRACDRVVHSEIVRTDDELPRQGSTLGSKEGHAAHTSRMPGPDGGVERARPFDFAAGCETSPSANGGKFGIHELPQWWRMRGRYGSFCLR